MAPLPETFNTGLVLGKFNPLTKGHQFLIDTAMERCRQLYISLSGRPEEAIPQSTRAHWLRTLYPQAIVVENPQTLPYTPAECPSETDFYALWTAELKRVCDGRAPDALFTSEPYGDLTAKHLGCLHISVDPERKQVPISATMVREKPLKYWDFLCPLVRSYFVKTISVMGPESTGKTTLCQNLAAHFKTLWQPEWARDYLGDRHCTYDDMEVIAKNHRTQYQALRQRANKLLFQDTNAITTKIYSEHYYKKCPTIVLHLANQSSLQTAHTLLTDIDVPWIPNTSRDLGTPAVRMEILRAHFRELVGRHMPFTQIQGNWRTRLETAIAVANELLNN